MSINQRPVIKIMSSMGAFKLLPLLTPISIGIMKLAGMIANIPNAGCRKKSSTTPIPTGNPINNKRSVEIRNENKS